MLLERKTWLLIDEPGLSFGNAEVLFPEMRVGAESRFGFRLGIEDSLSGGECPLQW